MSDISKVAERRANYDSEIGRLAKNIWQWREEIARAEERMRLLMGASQETGRSGPEIDTLQAIANAQNPAQENATPTEKAAEIARVLDTTGPPAPKVVDVKPKKKTKVKE